MGAEETQSPSPLIGGRYELESLLGRGGAGEVWRARHVTLNSHVAIKFLHSATEQLEATRKRFLKEAQVTAQLKTRHAVQVFDYGFTDEGQPYLVMELLDGETVGQRLTRLGRLPPEVTVAFLSQVARALERAHAIGIVHRDLKPDNLVIVVDEEGRETIKVLDFGIAKLLGDLDTGVTEVEDPTLLTAKALSTFTRTGAFLGTPLYMAPEQARNAADVDLRADVWAFGVVAYQCLTGKPPFEGKNLLELFGRIESCQHTPAVVLCPELPRAFDMWFEIACAPDRKARFSTARAAAERLALAVDPRASVSVDSFPGASRDAPASGSTPRAVVVELGGPGQVAQGIAALPAVRAGIPRAAWALLAVPLVAIAAWLAVHRAPGTVAAASSVAAPPPVPAPASAPAEIPSGPAPALASAAPAPPEPPPREVVSSRPPVAARATASTPGRAPAVPASAPIASTAPPGRATEDRPPAPPKPAPTSPFELPPLGI